MTTEATLYNRLRRAAKGGAIPRYPERRVFTVAFDTETIDQVRMLAAQSNVSVSEQIRTLVEWGLLDSTEAAS